MTKKTWDQVAFTVPSFVHDWKTVLSPEVHKRIANKFALLCDRYVHGGDEALRKYDTVAYLDNEPLELDVAAGWRAIVGLAKGRLILLKAGDHTLIPRNRFSKQEYRAALREPQEPFVQFLASFILEEASDPKARMLTDAFDDHWLYQLDKQQQAIVESLYFDVWENESASARMLITGGPGTGKTSILTQLASALKWDSADMLFSASIKVRESILAVVGEGAQRCFGEARSLKGQRCLLVDDPPDWFALQQAFEAGQYLDARLVVVATDLAQVKNVVSDNKIQILLGSKGIQHVELTDCYRQTAAVGKTSIKFLNHISTRFTKHLNEDGIEAFAREHELSLESANKLRFVHAGGFAKVFSETTWNVVLRELNVVMKLPLWRARTPICIVLEGSKNAVAALRKELKDVPCVVHALDDVYSIRGLEFQHVFIVVSQETLRELLVTGRRGLTTDAYLSARNLRIPFSRATDRLLVFGEVPPKAE